MGNISWITIPLFITFLIGIICPVTGAILITQKRSTQANLISYAVLPGLVISAKLQIDPIIGGFLSSLLGSFLAERFNQKFINKQSAAINSVLAGFTALGVLLVPIFGAQINLEAVLFGDLLSSNIADILRLLITMFLLLGFILFNYEDLIFLGVDNEGAVLAKRPVKKIYILSSTITTLVIISAANAVGIILVIGLLCSPVLINIDKAKSLVSLMKKAACTGFISSLFGLSISLVFDLPPGPAIGLICFLILFLKR